MPRTPHHKAPSKSADPVALDQLRQAAIERLRCSQRQSYWQLHARVLLGDPLSGTERREFITLAPIVRGSCPLCTDVPPTSHV